MSKDWSPMEMYMADKEFNFRKETMTWHIDGKEFPVTYEDGLSGTEKENLDKYPELIFLAKGGLDILINEGVDHDFISKIEEQIKSLEKEVDEALEKGNGKAPIINALYTKRIPSDIKEPMLTVYKWFVDVGQYYDMGNATSDLMYKLAEFYDFEHQAKQNVQDYLENAYDTIDEIR